MKYLLTHLLRHVRRFTLPVLVGLLVSGFALPATTQAASVYSAACGNNLSCVINFGNQQIQARLNALNTLNGRINYWQGKGALTDTQVSTLQADVSNNENGLSALQKQLDAETNIQNARQDVRNLYYQFRIYAVVLPRDYRTIHTDIAGNIAMKLQAMESDLQNDINAAPAGEQQQLMSYYNNFVQEVSDAASDVQTAQNELPMLTPTSFNNNAASYKTTLASVTSADQNAHKELHQAGYDLNQIEKVLG